MITILHEQRETAVDAAPAPDGALWIDAADLEQATGWSLKPQGFCLGDLCAPAPAADRARMIDGVRVNLAALWERLGAPLVHDEARSTFALGAAAADRAAALQSLEAPDFALPDLAGKTHRLSDYRGDKVLLATWASW